MNSYEMDSFLLKNENDIIKQVAQVKLTRDSFKLEYCDSTIEINALAKICKDKFGFRMSISDYVYATNSYLFGMLYMMAALLFIYNGIVYVKQKELLNIQRRGSWFNVFIGLSLIGVILNPASKNCFLHNLFSFLFFGINVLVILFLSKPKETRLFRATRIVMGILVLATILIWAAKVLDHFTLLWAEWVSLFIIAAYLIMMAASQLKYEDR
jgi:hypothetical protein